MAHVQVNVAVVFPVVALAAQSPLAEALDTPQAPPFQDGMQGRPPRGVKFLTSTRSPRCSSEHLTLLLCFFLFLSEAFCACSLTTGSFSAFLVSISPSTHCGLPHLGLSSG